MHVLTDLEVDPTLLWTVDTTSTNLTRKYVTNFSDRSWISIYLGWQRNCKHGRAPNAQLFSVPFSNGLVIVLIQSE